MNRIDPAKVARLRREALLQTGLLLVVMGLLFAALGWFSFGRPGVVWAGLVGLLLFVGAARAQPAMLLKAYGARLLTPEDSPSLYLIVGVLAARAGLNRPPQVYFVPQPFLNAFTVGSPDDAAIALTAGLVHRLGPRQITGVLAHEMAHIMHNDLRLQSFADMLTRVTSLLSLCGQIFIALYLPVMLVTGMTISVWPLAVLIFAPTISVLLQLALARTREYDADLSAALLTGDPRGLASALKELERGERMLWQLLWLPVPPRGRTTPLLKSHPDTARRVERLLELEVAADGLLPGEDLRLGTLGYPGPAARFPFR